MIGKLLFIVALTGLVACNKPLPDYSGQPFAYSVSGLNTVNVPSNDRGALSCQITLISGNPENEPITVIFRGLPPNVAIKDSITFRANYFFSDSVIARNAPQGTYPVQAVFSTPAGQQTDSFNLVVGAPIDRASILAGYYYGSNSCGENVFISATVDDPAGQPYKCRLIEYLSPGYYTTNAWYDTTYCNIDSFSNTLIIPSQMVHGVAVSGTGTFSNGSAMLTRTYHTDTSQYSCTVMLSNQP